MKRRTRQASKERRAERRAQAEADRDVREDWLSAIHGEREDLELLARNDATGKAARAAVLASSEVPDGVTHSMLRDACLRELGSMAARESLFNEASILSRTRARLAGRT